jgi:hypothetical protein
MSEPKGPWVAQTPTLLVRGKPPHRDLLNKYPAMGWWFAGETGRWTPTGTSDLEEAKAWVAAREVAP